MRLCVIGLGYIGLPTAATFASKGYDVLGVDINTEVIEALNQGNIIIEEPHLPALVREVVAKGKLKASSIPKEADVFIITVPTPIREDLTADMSYVEAATKSILPYIQKGNTIILESTSQVGTTQEMIVPLLATTGLDVQTELYVGYCPERVMPGVALEELITNSRVIGGITEEAANKIKAIYSSFVTGEMYTTNTTTAEMCKIMENTFRDVNIALANELGMLCEAIGIDAWEVISLCNKHPRVTIHAPGPGVGGHCLAVDPWFLVQQYPDIAKIIHLARQTNDAMPYYVAAKIEAILEEVAVEKKITLLGLTYKEDIDDLRESPMLKLIKILEGKEYTITCVDPNIKVFPNLEQDVIKACKDSQLVILGVYHQAFGELPYEEMAGAMAKPRLLDTRNKVRKQAEKAGFEYYVLGNGRL